MLPLIFSVAAFVYLAVLMYDIRYRLIPNVLSLILLVLAVARWAAMAQPASAFWAVVAAALVFLATSVMFSRGWLGGGDVKVMSASVLLIGAEDAASFLLVMALVGGVVSLLTVAWHLAGRGLARIRSRRTLTELSSNAVRGGAVTVPYGVAIAIAGMWTLASQLGLG